MRLCIRARLFGQLVISLRRQANSAIQSVKITSDSREYDVRKREIQNLLESAIQRAARAGVELVTIDVKLVSVTLANYKDLIFRNGNRPDTSELGFYVKSKHVGSTRSAQSRTDKFIKSVHHSCKNRAA